METMHALLNAHTGGHKEVETAKHIYMYLWYMANTITYRQLSNLFDVCASTSWNTVKNVAKWLDSISNIYKAPSFMKCLM